MLLTFDHVFAINDVDCLGFFGKTFQRFTPTTTSEVQIIILKCPNNSYDLDHFPSFLL